MHAIKNTIVLYTGNGCMTFPHNLLSDEHLMLETVSYFSRGKTVHCLRTVLMMSLSHDSLFVKHTFLYSTWLGRKSHHFSECDIFRAFGSKENWRPTLKN